jgi:ABC-type multidrug transport system ATPase subunit
MPTSRFKTPTIEFRGMGLTLAKGEFKGKTVLDNVSGVIPPGSFVAVMGPSGSGKSTFMHTLAGKAFYGNRSGKVLVNDDEIDLTQFAKVIGFVKQDDIMLREMTVNETLLFNARMRYDKQSLESPEEICNATLKVLDLLHVRDTNIGDEKKRGISGGQRKRVNIGMEMCALPCILFLDEPTSGLDSSSSMTVCSALRTMADSGVTVIAVIHQPRYEIFQMFHKVLLLAKGGKLVYYGSPNQALPYFEGELGIPCPEHVNPPDFFMDTISGETNAKGLTVDDMVEKWNNFTNKKPGTDSKQQIAGSSNSAPVLGQAPDQAASRGEEDTGAEEDTNKDEPSAGLVSANVLYGTTNGDSSKVYRAPQQTGNGSIEIEMKSVKPMSGKDLAAQAGKKSMPNPLVQLYYFCDRSMIQLSRDLAWFFTDLILVLVAGFFLGLVFCNSKYMPPLPVQIVNQSLVGFNGNAPSSLREFFNRPIDDPIISEASLTCMAIGMTGITAALRVFGGEQIVYWREASAGMSTVSYFLAKNITHLLFVVLSPLLYLTPFLTFVSARAPLWEYYWICVLLQFTTTGLGYLISLVVPSGLAQLAGVVTVLVFSMFGGARPTLPEISQMFPLLQAMPMISYIRWGQEALYLTEIRQWGEIQGVNIQPSLDLFGYNLNDFDLCVILVVVFGIAFRVFALGAMLVLNRDQKH